MIYGLYLSAAGVMASSYRQDVLANNIANAESVGFKRDLALFQQRPTAMTERGENGTSNPLLESMGGGMFLNPTLVDQSQGELEQTGSSLDVAIEGDGFFAVDNDGQKSLTRDGRLAISRDGDLCLANGKGQNVLDQNGAPIHMLTGADTTIASDGVVTQNGKAVARIGLFSVADRAKLTKQGGNMLGYENAGELQQSNATIHSEFVERANVDPTTELAALMDTQRQLEANANMIRYQDQTLQRLVNDVGKIS